MNVQIVFIDNDEVNNKIVQILMEKAGIGDGKFFQDPNEGLQYLAGDLSPIYRLLLFIDLNMPGMTGWNVLEKLPESILERIRKSTCLVYVLHNQVDKDQLARAKADKRVTHYLVKPLSRETIRLILFSAKNK